jgi:hypothetical protein
MKQKAAMKQPEPEPTEKTKASMATTEKTKASMATKEKVALGQALHPMVRHEKARMAVKESFYQQVAHALEKPEPVRSKITVRPTVKLERPAYGIVNGDDLDNDGYVLMTLHEELTTNETSAAALALQQFDAKIESTSAILKGDYVDALEFEEHGQVFTKFDDEDIDDIVGNTAHELSTDDPDWAPYKNTYRLQFRNEDDDLLWTEEVSYSQAQEMLGIEPKDFQVYVVRLEEGYDDPQDGNTYQVDAGTKYGNEVWATSGRYATLDLGSTYQTGHQPPVRLLNLVPEVEGEDFEID